MRRDGFDSLSFFDRFATVRSLGIVSAADAAATPITGVLGASCPIGAPTHTRTTLLADVFTEQAVRRGEDDVVGVEAGVRHQLTPRIVLDADTGTEVAAPADRNPLFFTVGVSFGF